MLVTAYRRQAAKLRAKLNKARQEGARQAPTVHSIL